VNGWTYITLSLLLMLMLTYLGSMIGGAVRHRRDR
jgi:hypothetical protein